MAPEVAKAKLGSARDPVLLVVDVSIINSINSQATFPIDP